MSVVGRQISDKVLLKLALYKSWREIHLPRRGREFMVAMDCADCGILVEKRLGAVTSLKCVSCSKKGNKTAFTTGSSLPAVFICEDCGKETKACTRGYLDSQRKTRLCQSCSKSGERNNQFGLSGNLSHNWLGGSKNWHEGRLTFDKNGLYWPKQQRLTMERDGYLCQKCFQVDGPPHTDPTGEYRLAVHHIIPFRISRSHAFENLLTVCRPCHTHLDRSLTDVKIAELQAVLQV